MFSACSSAEDTTTEQHIENTEYETQIQNESDNVIENNFEDANENIIEGESIEVTSVDLSKYVFNDMNLAVGCVFDLSEICSEEGFVVESKKENRC